MSDNLRERLVETAFHEIAMEQNLTILPTGPRQAQVPSHWREQAEARAKPYIDAVGPELDRLRAEVEASDERNVRLARRISELHDERNADVTVLRARLAKVEALADEWDREYTTSNGVDSYMRAAAYKVRVLASVPEPSDSEPAPDADREAGGA